MNPPAHPAMPLRAAKDSALLPCGWCKTSRFCLPTLDTGHIQYKSEFSPAYGCPYPLQAIWPCRRTNPSLLQRMATFGSTGKHIRQRMSPSL